jgi:acyl carrier protein
MNKTMNKNKQLKNKNNKGEMNTNTVLRSVRMRDYNQDLVNAINNFATQMINYTKDLAKDINIRVITIVAKQLPSGTVITPTKRIVDDLGADSLDVAEIILGIEEEFKIEFVNEDVEKFQTIDNIVAHLRSKGVK